MYDVGGKLLNGIKSMYVNSLACVNVKGGEVSFKFDSGARQGSSCPLAWIFNIIIIWGVSRNRQHSRDFQYIYRIRVRGVWVQLLGGQGACAVVILVLRECIWNEPAVSLVLPAFDVTGSLGSSPRQVVYPPG